MEEGKHLTVEDHVLNLGTPTWLEAGVRVREGYPDHFVISETAFKAACDRFLKGGTDGSAPVKPVGDGLRPSLDAKVAADAKAAADKAAADAKALAESAGKK